MQPPLQPRFPDPDTSYNAPYQGHQLRYHSKDQIIAYAASVGTYYRDLEATAVLAINVAARKTLTGLGYTYEGGEEWKPPLGNPKVTLVLLARNDELLQELNELRARLQTNQGITSGYSDVVSDGGMDPRNTPGMGF